MASDKVKVAIRVRPFNRREVELATKCVIEVKDQQIVLHHTNSASKSDKRQPKVIFYLAFYFSLPLFLFLSLFLLLSFCFFAISKANLKQASVKRTSSQASKLLYTCYLF